MLKRHENTIMGTWLQNNDFVLMGAFVLLMVLGLWILAAAGPAASSRLGLDSWYFVWRQLVFVGAGLLVMVSCSFFEESQIRKLTLLVLLPLCLLALFATVALAPEINGARRWLYFNGWSLQTSELLKPVLAVVFAQLLSSPHRRWRMFNAALATVLLAVVIVTLVSQPDIGQSLIILGIWLAEMFVFGLTAPVIGVLVFVALLVVGLGALVFDHVQNRLVAFFELGAEHYQYQTVRALDAIREGGLFGKGFGAGTIKGSIPDVHTDFIFAAAGEDLGAVVCLALLGLFGFVALRAGTRAYASQSNFIQIATAGLVTYLMLQVFINVGSTLHLIPTKGTTLPFVSYGGSSMIAVALGAGLLLVLNRRRISLTRGSRR